jgi:hypothetical protein
LPQLYLKRIGDAERTKSSKDKKERDKLEKSGLSLVVAPIGIEPIFKV